MSEPKASRPYMPGYGLPSADSGRGLLPFSWAEERLSRARNYFLSTVRPDGRPHMMPVWGVWLDGVFFFSTGRESRKASNLARSPACVLCPDDAEEPVVVEGVAEEVTEGSVLAPFLDAYEAKYNWRIDTRQGPLYVVHPCVVFGLIENAAEFAGAATRWTFEEG